MLKRCLLIGLLLLSGCSTAHVTTDKEGNCSADYLSVLKNTDTNGLSACGAIGSSTNSKVDSSMVNLLEELLLRAK